MKKPLLSVLVAASLALLFVPFMTCARSVELSPPQPAILSDPAVAAQIAAEKRQQEEAAALQQKYAMIFSQDPWREIDGATNHVSPDRWVIFSGKVLQVTSDGIRIDGRFYSVDQATDYNGEFFVASFPYQMAEDETVLEYTAKLSGVKTYTTVVGASRTIRNLEYGKVVGPPPPSPEEIAAAKAAAEARKQAEEARKKTSANNALKWNQQQADAGDPYGQYRMGQRYLRGDGVEKDLSKARDYFQKAAAQGNKDAADALQNLPAN